MKLLHVGFSNIVSAEKVVGIISPDTSSAKRIRDVARQNGNLIDCTLGRKSRSIVLTDSQYVFISSVRPEGLFNRMESANLRPNPDNE